MENENEVGGLTLEKLRETILSLKFPFAIKVTDHIQGAYSIMEGNEVKLIVVGRDMYNVAISKMKKDKEK